MVIEKDGKTSTIEAEQLLLSVGRKANLSGVGLDKLNIELLRNGVKVDEHLLTSHPRVYACGDITGYSLLAHTAIREAEVAINHILGVEDRMNYECVPGVVYTNPEVAGVGKTEEELIKQGIPYRVSKFFHLSLAPQMCIRDSHYPLRIHYHVHRNGGYIHPHPAFSPYGPEPQL